MILPGFPIQDRVQLVEVSRCSSSYGICFAGPPGRR